MKVFLAFFCVLGLASPCLAADSQIDALLEKARTLRKSNRVAEGKPFAEQAMNLAVKQNAWQQLTSARLELTFDESIGHNYDRVLQLRLANLDTVKSHREVFPADEEAAMLQGVCAAYDFKKDYPSAVRYCRETLTASELLYKTEKFHGLGLAHPRQALGINLFLAGQYVEAEAMLRKAYAEYLAFSQLTKDTQSVSNYEPQVETLRWLQRTLVAQHRTEEALGVAELGRSRALAATLASGSSPSSPLSIELIRKVAQDHGTTIVEYSLLYDYDPDLLFIFGNFEDVPVASIYIWVIQPSGRIDFHESRVSPQGPSLVNMVRGAHASLGVYTRGVTLEPDSTPPHQEHPLEDLYKLLISPVATDLPRDPAQNVTFVLQDWLFLVPFAALRDATGHYFIENHTISVAPSIDVLRIMSQASGQSGKGKGALVIGNPLMPSFAGREGETPRQLNALPGAEQEARTVATEFHTTPLVGPSATKAEVLRRLPNAQIAHFATHGLLDQKTGGFQSALALAPSNGDSGFLTAREIQHMKLRADLVVLSACDTALGKMSGDGIYGLSRSFMTAGAPSVIVSLWAISDESTAYLMDHFYRRMQAGQDKASSLREAMLETKSKYPAPLNWAAFVLLGETAFSPGSRSTSGAAEGGSGDAAHSSNFVFPLPQDVRDLREDPDPKFGGSVSSVTYQTGMSLPQLLAFYKREMEGRGLKEVPPVEAPNAKGFTLVYRGLWPDREAVLGASEIGSSRFMILRFEARRDDDAEFPAAVNQGLAGLVIPEHANAVDVDKKFDFSSGAGKVTFLSHMPQQQLHDLYRGVFAKAGFTEFATRHDDKEGTMDCEFRGKLAGRALFLHSEKSFMHPERQEVHVEFGTPSK